MPPAPTTVHIVPHTHWDREWYAPFQTFRAQLVDLWDNLLALTEADPGFRFLFDGQTVVIEDYLAIRPGNRERVDRAIRAGQVQVGPWYTLPDEFLVSGETLVRNLARGLELGADHGGAMRVGYLPDSFGHAAQMPQLYRLFGLQHAVLWRGVPRSIDRVAFDWVAPDGSTVLAAYLAGSYGLGADLPTTGDALARRIRTVVKAMEPYRPGPDILLMNGNDHVSPQPGLTAAAAAVATQLDGVTVRVSSLADYLDRLPPADWPAWTGELRASSRANVLMGTLSTRGRDKQAYFRAALSLERLAEPLAALTGLPVDGFLQEAWTLVLKNAAHDTACGSGIDAVAADARRRSEGARQLADAVVARGLQRVTEQARGQTASSDGFDVMVWNPSPFRRVGVVEVAIDGEATHWAVDGPDGQHEAQSLGTSPPAPTQRFTVRAEDVHTLLAWLDERPIVHEVVRAVDLERQGADIQVRVRVATSGSSIGLDAVARQIESLAATTEVSRFAVAVDRAPMQRLLVPTAGVDGLGWSRLRLKPGAAHGRPARAADDRLSNHQLTVKLESDGALTVYHQNLAFPKLHQLVDEADAGDEYNFSPIDEGKVGRPERVGLAWSAESGPLRSALERELIYRLPAALAADRRHRSAGMVEVPIRQRIVLEADQPRVDFVLELDNQVADHRLRVHFPIPFDVEASFADTPFHVTRRPVLPPRLEEGAPEWELPTHPMRSFVDLSDGRRGVTLITDGLHEYEVLPGPPAVLALTLIRAVGWLSRDDLRLRQGHAGPPLETPGAQAFGFHRFQYSLAFHEEGWEAGGAWRRAEAVLLPLQLAGLATGSSSPQRGPTAIELEPAAIQLMACRPAPGGYDLRVVNASDRAETARLRCRPVPKRVTRITPPGAELGDVAIAHGVAQLDLRSFEIASVRVVR